MTENTRTLVLDTDTGALSDGEMPVFIIPRELLISTAEEMSSSVLSFTGRGMMGIYRMVSRKMGQRIFEMHMPPEAEGKKGMDLINAVFDRFVTSGWGRYEVTQIDDDTHHVVSRYFWLSEALTGVDKKPICALMEGILGSLFTQAFDRKVEVREVQCVAIGDEVDIFEVKFK
jgi:predicted hydrocarbon binding protein